MLVTATGVLIIAGVTISAGTWLYKKIKKWINKKNIEKQEINEAKSKIPSRLKDKNRNRTASLDGKGKVVGR